MVAPLDDSAANASESDAVAAGAMSPWEALPRLRDLMQRYPFAICDVSFLPLPKADMKIALEVA